MRYRTGSDFETGSKFLSEPGCYHFVVASVRDPAATKDGAPIVGGLFSVSLSVLAGGDGKQKDKMLELTFFEPKMDSKDGGAFSRKKIDRFLLSTNLITQDAKESDVELDLGQCVGRQLCMKLEERKYNDRDGKERKALDIHFADIFHVDDPDCATWEKDSKSLAMIPKKYRILPANKVAEPDIAAKPATAAVDSLDI